MYKFLKGVVNEQGGQYDAAEKIFRSMTEGEGLKPDARMYNYMIHMYGKAGKAAEAQALIRQMKGLGLPMSAVTFNSLMSFQKTVPGAEATLRQVLCHKTRAGYLFFFPFTELLNWNLWQKPTYSGSDLTNFGFQSGLFWVLGLHFLRNTCTKREQRSFEVQKLAFQGIHDSDKRWMEYLTGHSGPALRCNLPTLNQMLSLIQH